MIGQQAAVLERRTGKLARWTASPAIAGRQRVVQLLSRSELAQLMVAMGLIALALLFYLSQATAVSVLEFRISDLSTQQQQLAMTNANLHAAATTLQSPGRIDAAAHDLHMAPPDLSTAVWIAPVVPQLPAARPLDEGASAARQRSQPLAWVKRFVHSVLDSL
jgi:cell division protein FtsB